MYESPVSATVRVAIAPTTTNADDVKAGEWPRRLARMTDAVETHKTLVEHRRIKPNLWAQRDQRPLSLTYQNKPVY